MQMLFNFSKSRMSVSNMERFPFNQNSGTENGTEISSKSFRKFRKLLNFRNANHSTENSGSKVEWNFSKNVGIRREVVLFFGNFG